MIEIIIAHYKTNHILHKFKDMPMLEHSITAVILSALVFIIIHSFNCI